MGFRDAPIFWFFVGFGILYLIGRLLRSNPAQHIGLTKWACQKNEGLATCGALMATFVKLTKCDGA